MNERKWGRFFVWQETQVFVLLGNLNFSALIFSPCEQNDESFEESQLSSLALVILSFK